MKSKPFTLTIEEISARLRPKHLKLRPEDELKAYHNNLFILSAILLCLVLQLGFYIAIPAYPFYMFLILQAYHFLMIWALFEDPNHHKLIVPLVVVYMILIGPLLMKVCEIGFTVHHIFSLVLPVFVLFTFKRQKVAFSLFLVELIKMHHVYRDHLSRVIAEHDKEYLVSLLIQDYQATYVIFPAIYLTFWFFYTKSRKNEKAIKKMNRELQSNKEDLNQKELFILSLSHEVRNPLNSILGNIELALDEASDSRLKQKLFNAKICGELLLSLINNVLDVGKADIGNIEICPVECNLLGLIEKVWMAFKEMIKNKGLKPRIEIASMLPKMLLLDEHRLTQILFNLISNAIKFTEKGEIRLRLFWKTNPETSITEIDEENIYIPNEGKDLPCYNISPMRLRSSMKLGDPIFESQSFVAKEIGEIPILNTDLPGILVLQVIDTGPGIAEKDRKNLFHKFVQVGDNQKKSMLGTGLGLWITKKICHKMGGDIEVKSEVGKGTIFSVKLKCTPCKGKLSKLGGLVLQRKKSLSPRTRAMIVEDSSFNAEIISNYLKSFKIDVAFVATDGQQAVKFYEKSIKNNNPIQLITMDLEMPIMDGMKATQEIRKLEAKYEIVPPAVIVIISGNSVETQIFKCINPEGDVRADYFIRKPIKKQELEQYIKPFSQPDIATMDIGDVILVADDDHFNLQLIQELLVKAGIDVLLAQNGQEAVDLYIKNQHRVRLILMDCEMRIMDGFSATRKIMNFARANESEPPVVYGLTGHSGKEYEEKCKQAGMKDMIMKPISFHELLKVINSP